MVGLIITISTMSHGYVLEPCGGLTLTLIIRTTVDYILNKYRLKYIELLLFYNNSCPTTEIGRAYHTRDKTLVIRYLMPYSINER